MNRFFQKKKPFLLMNRVIWILLPWLFVFSCSAKSASPPLQSPPVAFQPSAQSEHAAHPLVSDLIAEVLMRIQLDYVELNRLNPQQMLQGALQQLSRQIPEIRASLTLNPGHNLLSLVVENQQVQFPLQPMRHLDELNHLLQKIVAYIQEHWETPNNLSIVEYALIQGMLAELDPHSALLPKEVYNEFEINTRGNFGGVGLVVGIRDNQMTVITPIDGAPAAKAGIQAMDRIVRIGDESTENMDLTNTVNKLRGAKGSKLILYIMRPGFKAPQRFEMIRAIIQIDSVVSADLTNEKEIVRYLKIKNFQQHTDEDLVVNLKNLDSLKGLILDMRNNPGGLLDQAVKVSDRFLSEKKTIVSTIGNRQNSSLYQSHWALSDPRLLSLPTVILVNRGSASASEIVASALKNNNRAILLGEQTFGKGSVQTVWPLRDQSALKLTVAQYLTPGNKSIQSVGVTPDIELYPVVVNPNQMKLIHHKVTKEETLARHFQGKDQVEQPVALLPYLLPYQPAETTDLLSQENAKNELKEDFFIKFAQQILTQHPQGSQTPLMETALAVQKRAMKEQDAKIVAALAKHQINWKLFPTQASPQLQIDIQTELKTNATRLWIPAPPVVPAGAEIRFKVTVKNLGKGAVNRLLAVTQSLHSLFNQHELPFGYLAPGESQTRQLQINLPKNLDNSIYAIHFNFIDHQMKNWASQQIFLASQERQKARFEFELALWDDGQFESEGNGDQKIQTGEKIALSLTIKNVGKGASENTIVLLKKNLGQPEIRLTRSRVSLGLLAPQQEKHATLVFQISKDTPLEKLKVFVEIRDAVAHKNNLVYQLALNETAKVPHFYQPPVIDYKIHTTDTSSNRVTTSENIQLEGTASDDQQMRDVFIFLNKQKVFFQTNRGKKPDPTLAFMTTLKLQKGHNRIVIFARDQDNLVISREMQIWRKKPS